MIEKPGSREEAIAQLTYEGRPSAITARLLDGLVGREHPAIPGVIMNIFSACRMIDDFDLMDDNAKHGWVDREGGWMGCAYASHDRLLYALGTTTQHAEELGWARVGLGGSKCLFRLSPKQKRAIRTRGNNIDESTDRAKPRFGAPMSVTDYVEHARSHEDEPSGP